MPDAAGGRRPIVAGKWTMNEREAGQTERVLRRQVRSAVQGQPALTGLVLAYEPVWAIGTGRAATAADANAGNGIIRDELATVLGVDVAARTRIQYGGSV